MKARKALLFTVVAFFLSPAYSNTLPPKKSDVTLAHLTLQAPLIIDDDYRKKNGSIISGQFQGTTKLPAITIKTTQPITIQNAILVGPGDLIVGDNVQVTILETYGISTNPNKAGVVKGKFISLKNPLSLRVEHCYTNMTGGILIEGYTGNHLPEQTIHITHNRFDNIDSRPSNGHGGYQLTTAAPDNLASAIQLNNIPAVAGIEIAWNQIMNQPYDSAIGDIIHLHQTSGTPTHPILIHDNYLQGAYAANPLQFPQTYSSSSIVLEGTAESATAFTHIYANQIVSMTNNGIAITSGHDNAVFHNRIISSGFITQPITQKTTLIATQNANSYLNAAEEPPSVFLNNHIHDNYGCIVTRDPRDPTGNTPRLGDEHPALAGQNNALENNLFCAVFPNATDETSEYYAWKTKVIASNQTIGPTWG